MTLPTDIQAHYDEVVEVARTVFQQDPDDFTPFGLVFDQQGERTGVMLDGRMMNDPAAKTTLMEVLSSHLVASGARCCCLATDAWIACVKSATEVPTSLRDYPGRQEALMITLFGPGLKPRVTYIPYRRLSCGIVFEAPFRSEDGDVVTNRMAPDLSTVPTGRPGRG